MAMVQQSSVIAPAPSTIPAVSLYDTCKNGDGDYLAAMLIEYNFVAELLPLENKHDDEVRTVENKLSFQDVTYQLPVGQILVQYELFPDKNIILFSTAFRISKNFECTVVYPGYIYEMNTLSGQTKVLLADPEKKLGGILGWGFIDDNLLLIHNSRAPVIKMSTGEVIYLDPQGPRLAGDM
jgi:hypothetical protein